MARDSFEIYYFQNSRWSVHASFEANQRELALAEAQKVEKTLGFPVRLVRETFYAETNTSEEVVSWQSAKAKQMGDPEGMFGGGGAKPAAPKKKPKPAAPVAPRRAEVKTEPAPAQASAPKKVAKKAPKKKKKKSRGLVRKVVTIVLFSSINAVLVYGTTLAVLSWILPRAGIVLPRDYVDGLPPGLFLLAYLMSAVYYGFKQFEIRFGWRRKQKAKARNDDDRPSAADMLRRMRDAQVEADVANADMPPALAADVDIEELREQIEQTDAEDVADRTGADDFATDVQEAPAEEPAPPPVQPETPPPAPQPPKQEKAPEPAPKPQEKAAEKPAAPEKPAESPAEAEARQGLAAFARDALAAASHEQPQLNAFSRFGLNLYIAGACAMIGQAKKLGRSAQLLILRDSLQAAGNTRERAESFCAELPSHGKNQRYAAMIQAGSAAMTRQVSGQPAGTQELTELLADWSKPEKRPTVPSSFTFLFTDIVNSTALTSQLGNAGAQRVVRAHNTAVRGAIQASQGREVKHTGDGIMATFPTPIAAVQAAIRAQKEITAHNAANPSIAFSIRIGINVGEAVEEDNDFFGAAVQMTARICSVATAANAWVSRAIVDACKGQRVGFIPRGAFQMKGIQQARPLYEIAYTDAHKNEIANL